MKKYTFKNGAEAEIKNIITPDDINEMFKVNLPSNNSSYKTGNGEGVWACATPEDTKKVFEDYSDEVIFVKILNDSYYYPTLKCNTIIPVKLRGKYRPIGIYDELQYHYNDGDEEDIEKNRKSIIMDVMMSRKVNK